jgi:hypothetical protein
MPLVDLEYARREPAGINGQPDTLAERLNGGFAHRVAEVEVVDNDVHSGPPSGRGFLADLE